MDSGKISAAMLSERKEETDARFVQYVQLFKNALVYTIVMNNVKALISGREGSLSLLVFIFIAAASFFFKLEKQVEALPPNNGFRPSVCFFVSLASNASVQFTSLLVAELASKALMVESTGWSLFGAFISIVLVYIMQRASVGASIPCIEEYNGN